MRKSLQPREQRHSMRDWPRWKIERNLDSCAGDAGRDWL